MKSSERSDLMRMIPRAPRVASWAPPTPATSPMAYLHTPHPVIVRSFVCMPRVEERIGDRTYVIPAYCSNPAHGCPAQLAGHDPGDEDRRR